MLPLAGIPAAIYWVAPTPVEWLMLIGLGLGGAVGVFFVSRAYHAADASAVVPYDFLRLPMTAFAAFVIFGETVDLWTWVGAAIIFGAIYNLARLDARPKPRPA
jgi:drug/metabolite transporter (DMT)-like permease